MKKTTIINHTTSAGKSVVITITRIYGIEKESVNLDGDIFMTEEFQDRYILEVEYDGKRYIGCRIQHDEKAPGGRFIRLQGRDALCLPADKWEEVDRAISERLTEELTPSEVEEIEEVKKAVESGRVMPKEELDRKRQEYDRVMNEGGEGYNPYMKYLSKEYVESVKAKFPEQFKSL